MKPEKKNQKKTNQTWKMRSESEISNKSNSKNLPQAFFLKAI